MKRVSPKVVRDGNCPERPLTLRALRSRELVYVLAGVGILLRVAQYASNRSLWSDESALALNLIRKGVADLAGPLYFGQAAPVGFLFTEGIAARVLGFSEYALRLFPLICGLLSIPAFIWLARRTLASAAAPLAILLFVVADGLIYYSSELKPYETDVIAALGLLVAGVVVIEAAAGLTVVSTIAFALSGVCLVAFSFSAAFIVAALAVTLIMWVAINGRREFSVGAAVVLLSWVITSIGIVILAAVRTSSLRESFALDSGSFLGISGSSSPVHAVNVMGTQIARAIGLPQERPFNHIEKLAVLCAIVGAVAVLRRKPAYFGMLVLPFPLLLTASALGVYPILERAELFLIPAVVLLIAEGVYQLVRLTPTRARVVVGFLLAIGIAGGPVWNSGKHLIQPRKHEEVRPVLEFVRDHWHPGDTLYVYYGAQYAFLYYDECKCLGLSLPKTRPRLWPLNPIEPESAQYSPAAVPLTPNLILGRHFSTTTVGPYIRDLNRAEGRQRIWFLYSHLNYTGEQSMVEAMLRHLDSIAKPIDRIDRLHAHAYLYKLREPR